MREINIGRHIVMKRKEKGITQDELASYIGVSKASVSKWETGQSYPDITFLPRIASYFNVTIDELMDYSPQMSKEDIKKLYHQLSSSFASDPFDEVLSECRSIIKEYYSCFPLLFQMIVLLVNHHMLANEKEEQEAILKEAITLCTRVKVESHDIWLVEEATSVEAACYLALNQPEPVIHLLKESIRPMITNHELVAQAYEMMGETAKAKEMIQVSMYQHLLAFINGTPSYLMLYKEDSQKVEAVLQRTLAVSDSYNLKDLHPNTMAQVYYTAAQVYATQGNCEKALAMLDEYADVCTSFSFPLVLHGDSFFDEIDGWFADLDLGAQAPRDERVIKENMLQGILENPAFSFLNEEIPFQTIVEKLKRNIGGH